ncbi:MAG: TonB-dependent receptor [Bacteriovoracaceae bacterium]|nr:TonB-dependent receptor [Bacteriovoracaceae bacterium]
MDAFKLIIFFILPFSLIAGDLNQTYHIDPTKKSLGEVKTVGENAWSEELESGESSSLKNKLKEIPALNLKSKSTGNHYRMEEFSIQGKNSDTTSLKWAAQNFRSGLSGRSQMEMIPLGDFKSVELSSVGDSSSPGGEIRPGERIRRPFSEVSADGLGHYGIRAGTGTAADIGLTINLERNLAKQKIYDHRKGQRVDLDNDREDFISLNGVWEIEKNLNFGLFHSRTKKGISGDFTQNFQNIEEDKNLSLIYFNSQRKMGGLTHDVVVSGKLFRSKISDPFKESQNFGSEFSQKEQNIAGSYEFGLKRSWGEMRPSFQFDGGEFEVAGDARAASVYKRKSLKLRPHYKFRFFETKLSSNLIYDNYLPSSSPGERHRSRDYSAIIYASPNVKKWNISFPVTLSYADRSPTLVQKFGNNSLYQGNPNLISERYPTLEAGFEYKNSGQFISLIYFHSRPKNLISYEQTSFNSFRAKNIGKVWINGGRVESILKVSEYGLAAKTGATYQQVLNNTDGSNLGNNIPFRPKYQISSKLSKSWGDILSVFYRLEYTGRYFSDDSNIIEYPSYLGNDIGFEWKPNRLFINGGINNVLDKHRGKVSTEALLGSQERAIKSPLGEYKKGRNIYIGAGYVF